jgi:hypothetical protein
MNVSQCDPGTRVIPYKVLPNQSAEPRRSRLSDLDVGVHPAHIPGCLVPSHFETETKQYCRRLTFLTEVYSALLKLTTALSGVFTLK